MQTRKEQHPSFVTASHCQRALNSLLGGKQFAEVKTNTADGLRA